MTNDHIKARILTLFESRRADRMTDYLARARRFGGLGDADVIERWIGAYRAWSCDIANAEAQRLEEDLEAELGLRGIETPIDAVRDSVEAVVQHTRNLTADAFDDPEQRRELGRQMLEDIEEYEQRLN